MDRPLTGTKEKKGRIGAEAHRAAAGGQGGERHWLQMASLFSLKRKMCYLINLKDKVMDYEVFLRRVGMLYSFFAGKKKKLSTKKD